MAGDWIKMRIDLQSHPKTVRIMSATGSDKFRVIGGLHAVWSVFDTHSGDGKLRGYTPELLDQIIGWQGFSRAMESVKWLEFDGIDILQMPEFAEHNGQSGKRRAEDQKRKRDSRNCPLFVRNESADEVDKKRTREEKRREEEARAKDGAGAPSSEVDPDKAMWDAGKALLGQSSGSLIGKLVKEHGKAAVMSAIAKTAAARPVVPKEYLLGILAKSDDLDTIESYKRVAI